MSALFDVLKSEDLKLEHWRPYGEQLIHRGERGMGVQDLIKNEKEGAVHEKIAQFSLNLMYLLEGDRRDFLEGWSRLQSVCYQGKIDLSEKYKEGTALTENEIKTLTNCAFNIKKLASKAAVLWLQSSSSTGLFCDQDLPTREKFINLAKSNNSKVSISKKNFKRSEIENKSSDFKSWSNHLAKSPEISNFKVWY